MIQNATGTHLDSPSTHVMDFLASLKRQAPMYYKAVAKTHRIHGPLFVELAEPMLNWAHALLGDQYLTTLIDGYLAFVSEVNESQIQYESTGRYAHASFVEVYDQTYDSNDFMQLYHWGVYVTTFAWEHHLKLYKFFRDEFLGRLSQSAGGRLLDLGSGSGIYNLIALHQLPAWQAVAVDISETSVGLSRAMTRCIGLGERVSHKIGDALQFVDPQPFDAGVTCFLLEHLEQPQALLNTLANCLATRGYAFITAAITAAEIDHIYEFKRETEVLTMAEAAGFRVVAVLSAAPEAIPQDRYFLPRSLGMVLQKRKGEIW